MYITVGTEGSINRIMDTKGNILSTNDYEEIYDFEDSLAPFLKDGLWGYIDKNGTIVIERIFERAHTFSGGMATVDINGKSGIINRQGRFILEPEKPEKIISNYDGIAIIEKDSKYIYMDQFGKEIFKIDKKEVSEINGFSYKDEDSKITLLSGEDIYINIKGERVEIETEERISIKRKINYHSMNEFCDDMAIFEIEKKYGCVNRKGEILIEPEYERFFDFVEGVAQVGKNGKMGLIDKTLKEVTPLIYDFIDSPSEGMLHFELHGKHGYMNKMGEILIAPIYDDADYFQNGIAIVKENNGYGLIDKNGKVIIEPIYYGISNFVGKFILEKEEKEYGLYKVTLYNQYGPIYGVIDKTGKVVIDIIYDCLTFFTKVED